MLRFDVLSRLPRMLSQEDLEFTAKELTRALRLKRASVVGVTMVSEARMQAINKGERGQVRPTDVLSFANAKDVRALTPKDVEVDLGEIIICPVYAFREARRRSINPREELIRLLVHGVLHLEGYDHAKPKDEAKMFALQERIVSSLMSSSL